MPEADSTRRMEPATIPLLDCAYDLGHAVVPTIALFLAASSSLRFAGVNVEAHMPPQPGQSAVDFPHRLGHFSPVVGNMATRLGIVAMLFRSNSPISLTSLRCAIVQRISSAQAALSHTDPRRHVVSSVPALRVRSSCSALQLRSPGARCRFAMALLRRLFRTLSSISSQFWAAAISKSPNPSIERTSSSQLRCLAAAAHVQLARIGWRAGGAPGGGGRGDEAAGGGGR